MKRLNMVMWAIFLLWMGSAYATTAGITFSGCQQVFSKVNCRIQSTEAIHYRYFQLQHPQRLVLDLSPAHLVHQPVVRLAHNTIVKAVRYSHHAQQQVRFVFDLNYQVPIVLLKQMVHRHIQLSLQFGVHNKKISKSSAVNKVKQHFVIVIDPGHGGKDPGATGLYGIHEKNLVLLIARRVQHILNQQPEFSAVLTRTGDYYLTLRQRLAIARKDKADMFIAIHADAFPRKYAVGASVYALSLRGATSEAARWLARRENESELVGGVALNDKSPLLKTVLLNLSQSATIRASLRIGQGIIQALRHLGPLHHDSVEQAAFVVLKSPDIPSLLVETGFISNPREERQLRSAWYQQQLAIAITQGIENYFRQQK